MVRRGPFERELRHEHFRVVIFGSARIARDSPDYRRIYRLAKMVGEAGFDVVTGGGPGLMDAAMSGHYWGRRDPKAHEIGLQIKLPHEQRDSSHYDLKKEFSRFSERLDTFMFLADVVVVAPGGVGTLLELLYTWQLMQVEKVHRIPIILLGEMWPGLVEWVKRWPLADKLLDQKDVDLLFLAKDEEAAFEIIEHAFRQYKEVGPTAYFMNGEKRPNGVKHT